MKTEEVSRSVARGPFRPVSHEKEAERRAVHSLARAYTSLGSSKVALSLQMSPLLAQNAMRRRKWQLRISDLSLETTLKGRGD